MKQIHLSQREPMASVIILPLIQCWDVYFPPVQLLQPHPVGTVYDLLIMCPSVHASLTVFVAVVWAWQHLHLLSNPCITDVYEEVEPQNPEHSIKSGTSTVLWHKAPLSWMRKKPIDCVELWNITCGWHAWHKLFESLPREKKNQEETFSCELLLKLNGST